MDYCSNRFSFFTRLNQLSNSFISFFASRSFSLIIQLFVSVLREKEIGEYLHSSLTRERWHDGRKHKLVLIVVVVTIGMLTSVAIIRVIVQFLISSTLEHRKLFNDGGGGW